MCFNIFLSFNRVKHPRPKTKKAERRDQECTLKIAHVLPTAQLETPTPCLRPTVGIAVTTGMRAAKCEVAMLDVDLEFASNRRVKIT